MQRNSPNESKIPIPPNLLKNFNAYDILEPQKNGAKTSDANATKVDKLIDIDDSSTDLGFQGSGFNASFLDTNRDFTLVDLYQNIFVTPQHIKKKETASDDVGGTLSASTAFDAAFFDMLESDQKIDWTNIGQKKEETISEQDFIEEKPRVLIPKVFTESDSDSDPEDLIYEVLAQKNLEKLVLDNSSNSRNVDSSKNIKNTHEFPKCYRLDMIYKNTKDSKFESGSNENKRPSDIKTYPLNSQINNSLSTFNVQAITKDEKVYKKKRIITPEHLKANYTKGPDFYEKSVVLPQIMARLNDRLDYLDEKANHKKRLILDVGAKPVKTSTSNANEPVIRKPNNRAECSTSSKTDQVKRVNKSGSGIHSLNLDHTILVEAKLCINKLTQNIAVHTKDKPCMNCSKPSVAKNTDSASVKTHNDFGKLSPKVLMDDCNRERLRALKRSQMFKDFVLYGKY